MLTKAPPNKPAITLNEVIIEASKDAEICALELSNLVSLLMKIILMPLAFKDGIYK